MSSRFTAVGSTMPYLDMEQRQRDFWRERRIFERSIVERPAGKLFSFYEGPPTANGAPGVHHVLSRVYKDLFPRYKTMRGYRAPRKAGWDTHGLPVELEVERELGLDTKAEIEEFGIAEFNRRCRESVMRYVSQWRDLTDRIAFWIDMDDAYVTFHAEYVESVWWIFKSLWDGDLIYEARRVTPHCPRCETSLSSHELSLGYQEDTPDPSITIKFRALPESLPPALRGFAGRDVLRRLDDDALDAAGQHGAGRRAGRDVRRRRDGRRGATDPGAGAPRRRGGGAGIADGRAHAARVGPGGRGVRGPLRARRLGRPRAALP